MRRRPLSSLLLAAVLTGGLAGPAVLTGPAAAQEQTAPAALTLALADPVITAGERTTARGTGTPGDTVELSGWSRPSTTFVVLGSTVVGADGGWSFDVAPTTNSRYSVRDTAGEQAGAQLLVRPAVTLEAVTRTAGDELLLTGTVFPATTGTPVRAVFERDGVRTVEGQTRTSRGRYQLRLTSTRRGAVDVTTTTPATLDNAAGESPAQRVVLVPQQADPQQDRPAA